MYSREINGTKLTLAPSGWTYKRTFVLYDKETGSLWYPVRKGLKAIQGDYFGHILPEKEFSDTTWRKWLKKYPESRIVK